MKTSKIAAVFQGSNGSLGYKTGTLYHLTLTQEIKVQGYSIITIFSIKRDDRKDGKGYCQYASIHALLDNWSIMHKYK